MTNRLQVRKVSSVNVRHVTSDEKSHISLCCVNMAKRYNWDQIFHSLVNEKNLLRFVQFYLLFLLEIPHMLLTRLDFATSKPYQWFMPSNGCPVLSTKETMVCLVGNGSSKSSKYEKQNGFLVMEYKNHVAFGIIYLRRRKKGFLGVEE